ncbi:F0F1 ATP synthase subunit epsilon [Alkalilimnicola ehrlichii MLHE-1]|uniref:ATP synthase epsilon chain n=1 Tax=Alkalilimnicola ehrlichii (strain ATCC BAA-1101 / DSM 17681 / MLHE-1) TaxID=187272 RepID=ATPE_ALKEH|nr:F0F1 ATP synthase subunit epsilon [Alkalilimnicola ehrlichii]Q0A4M9.1 RecName: Full=ATP synthase epsilon chain; AltName: Full=ATP synthase F1 sector epsilon subunit; AltName: Full=F-ATPase epsilon subunit [Alkalilimnicola ehrlichii MLHE-1]ABI58208.1 ATP synthase F1 subcomplex epsilon subunit [Alkalilimnicola ehrlichii MLHE-1]
MSTLHVDIVSAEQAIHSGEAKMLVAPAREGDIGITPRHAPLLTKLRPGEVRVQDENGEERFFYVSGGIIEVQPHKVTVLADTAARARDLDEAAAQEAKRRAEEALANRKAGEDYSHVQAELAEAMAQLQTLERLRRRAKR